MDIDDQHCRVELALQSLVLARELLKTPGLSQRQVDLWTTFWKCDSTEFTRVTLGAPTAQAGRINAYFAKQRTDLTGLNTRISFGDNATLLGIGETAPRGTCNDLRVALRG